MENRIFGYARVSERDQNEDRQLEAFVKTGIEERFIFTDKQSGKDFNRPQYKILINGLRQGDLLIIKSIDRLGRNYTEIQTEWKRITKEIKANIKVLDMPLLDTTTHRESLTDTFISDIVLQILAYVAEQERQNIKTRQAEGIAVAKAQGKHLGRPKATYPDKWKDIYSQWKTEEISGVKAMEMLSLKKNTFYKLVKKYEDEENKALKP